MIKRYNDYNSYLKDKYGCKVYKIGIDAGFTCPTRDGTKGFDGCAYCNQDGSRSPYTNQWALVSEQLHSRIAYLKGLRSAKKFIAYFQAFTNTHAPLPKLKNIYDQVLDFEDIVGISIGTRPDAIDIDKLNLISSYSDKYEVWVEYGLQSIHDRTLKFLKRGHTYEDFTTALALTKEFDIKVCVHVILGLPGETRDDVIKTAQELSRLMIDGVKIHIFHILKGSRFEKLYYDAKIELLEQDEYVELVCDFLEYLSKDIIIQRLTGQGSFMSHIAPLWALEKTATLMQIGEALKRRGTSQGRKCEAAISI